MTEFGNVSHQTDNRLMQKSTTRLCELDPELYNCLQDPAFRRLARKTLASIYFLPVEQVMLCARLGIPAPRTSEIDTLKAQASEYKARQKKGRDSRFKSDVLGGYYFTCALTGYRLDTETTSIVQAAHIHQHALSGNDDPRNGLALSPDAHWMFDQGLWTATPKENNFIIQVAKNRFTEFSRYGQSLSARHGTLLHFHQHARLRPANDNLLWHAKNYQFAF